MKKKNCVFFVILLLFVIFSIIYTIVSRSTKETKLNTNVNVTVNLNSEDKVVDNTREYDKSNLIDDKNEYVGGGNSLTFITDDMFYSSVEEDDNVNLDNEQDTISSEEYIIENTLTYENFVDTFTELLNINISNVDIEKLPITQNMYNEIENGIVYDDAYNNGFIILKAGLNTDNNTFMCLIRTVNYRTYFKGTLIDGKIDTLTSTILN